MSTDRRALLAGIPAALLASTAPVIAGGAPDAELIRRCRQFAEQELAHWYAYVVAPDGVADQLDYKPDWEGLRWITATPATTPAGWKAKALAFSAWDREAYDNAPDEGDTGTPLLSSLLRDMIRAERATIIERLAAKHGPLPKSYTSEGIWLGSPPT